jgi:hypothetical protein
MNLKQLFLLEWKAFKRHPLFYQNSLMLLIFSILIVFIFLTIYNIGGLFALLSKVPSLNKFSPFKLVLLYSSALLCVDYIIKSIYRNNQINIHPLRKYPFKDKELLIYLLIKECFSFWNISLLLLLLQFIIINIIPEHGILISLILICNLYFGQIFVSIISRLSKAKLSYMLIGITCLLLLSVVIFYSHLTDILMIRINIILWFLLIMINYKLFTHLFSKIKYEDSTRIVYDIFFRYGIMQKKQSYSLNFIILNLKMIWRSPRLKYQFFLCLILIAVYSFIIVSKDIFFNIYQIRIILISLCFCLFPLIFNQYIFSSEGSFFKLLVLNPSFPNYFLKSKYIQYVCFSLIPFSILIIITCFKAINYFYIIAISFYSLGIITLLSFCSILFVNSRYNLFGSYTYSLSKGLSLQTLIVILIYSISIGLVILISIIFNEHTAMIFMLVTGCLGIMHFDRWIKFIFNIFWKDKYREIEIIEND